MVQDVGLPQPPRRFLKTSKSHFKKLGLYGNSDDLEPKHGFDPILLKPNSQSNYDESTWPKLDYLARNKMSKTRAMANFLLTSRDLQDICWVEGPLYKMNNVHNYLVSELRHRAWEKYGGPTGLQAALVEHGKGKKKASSISGATQAPTPSRPTPSPAKPSQGTSRVGILGKRAAPAPPQTPRAKRTKTELEADFESSPQFSSPSSPPMPATPQQKSAFAEPRVAGPSTPTTPSSSRTGRLVQKLVDIDLTKDESDDDFNPFATPSRPPKHSATSRFKRSPTSPLRKLKFLGVVDISD